MKELKTYSNPDAKVFLIGNKLDLESKREVTYEEANKYKEDVGFNFFMECSAKNGINSQDIFVEAAKILYDDYIKYNTRITDSKSLSNHNSKVIHIGNVFEEKQIKEEKKICC